MKRYCLSAFMMVMITTGYCQKNNSDPVARPKLVVGIVVDQMRWDYIYRYWNEYKSTGGFKKFLSEGFTCDNTFIPYAPTVTAAGHSCVYTGSVPSVNGIAGNSWYDRQQNREVYCTDDSSAHTVGSATVEVGRMSPRNLFTTTITDELRIATNFKSKVIGIAIKDRGAILPAGHSANAAYWYDSRSGNFVTSTYYMNTLPAWVENFNKRKVVDSLYKLNWNLSLSKEIYTKYSSADEEPYEGKPFGPDQIKFPYNFSKFVGTDYSKIAIMPQGNTLTLEMAKAAITAEGLGKSDVTDFLAVSFSSPDYIGHTFGPNSWEQMDDFLKLDEVLENLFSFLDEKVGKDQYTVFLTADHGVAHNTAFMQEHKLPGGLFNTQTLINEMNVALKEKFKVDNLILGTDNLQVYLNDRLIADKNIDKEKIKGWIVDYLMKNDAVSQAFDEQSIKSVSINEKQKEMFVNGYNQKRSGDIVIVLKPGYMEGSGVGTTHGLWNPYDSHIPLLWFGWGIQHGKTNEETYMTDISATLAALLHIQMPSGCVGTVIDKVMNP